MSGLNKRKKAYMYIRVSTEMQVDGYSLEAQKNIILKKAELSDIDIVGEYKDEGKSGKNDDRPAFQQMMSDIKYGKDNVDYVMVFKMSRFARNAADTLKYLSFMQEYGVNLKCAEEEIDTSKEFGKMVLTLMAAVSEMELENIHTQTMAGRRQKARNGKWNGGFAPYGYELKDGELVIVEDEAKTIRYIFELFTTTSLGINGVAKRLALEGIEKKIRHNGKRPVFTANLVRRIIDNPVYVGKISYGRMKTEKIKGTNNKTHTIKEQELENIIVSDGTHEPIISQEVWDEAVNKRQITGGRKEKKEKEHEYIFSGLVLCPGCGYPMYGAPSRKKKKDGTYYPTSYSYLCRQKKSTTGRECSLHKQFNCKDIDEEIYNAISLAFITKENIEKLTNSFNKSFDISSLTEKLKDLEALKKKTINKQNMFFEQQYALDPEDKFYKNKYEMLNSHIEKTIEEIENQEKLIEELKQRIDNELLYKSNTQNAFQMLLDFGENFRYMSDVEKKKLANTIIKSIEIFPTKRAYGYLKKITFRIPVQVGREVKDEMTIWDQHPLILDANAEFNKYDIDKIEQSDTDILSSGDIIVSKNEAEFAEFESCPSEVVNIVELNKAAEQLKKYECSEAMTNFLRKRTHDETVALLIKKKAGK